MQLGDGKKVQQEDTLSLLLKYNEWGECVFDYASCGCFFHMEMRKTRDHLPLVHIFPPNFWIFHELINTYLDAIIFIVQFYDHFVNVFLTKCND